MLRTVALARLVMALCATSGVAAACGAAPPQPLVVPEPVPVDPNVKADTPKVAAAGSASHPVDSLPPPYSPVEGLEIQDIVVGNGREAHAGDRIMVLYDGTLEDGTVFDSTAQRNDQAATFRLGQGSLIKGWELGIPGMKVGGKRKLTVSPELAYGRTGRTGAIPPGATLTFVVQLVDVL